MPRLIVDMGIKNINKELSADGTNKKKREQIQETKRVVEIVETGTFETDQAVPNSVVVMGKEEHSFSFSSQ